MVCGVAQQERSTALEARNKEHAQRASGQRPTSAPAQAAAAGLPPQGSPSPAGSSAAGLQRDAPIRPPAATSTHSPSKKQKTNELPTRTAPTPAVRAAASTTAHVLQLRKKPWSVNFLRRTEAPLRGRLAERVCRFAHSLNLLVRGLPAPPRVHRVPASQLSRMRV